MKDFSTQPKRNHALPKIVALLVVLLLLCGTALWIYVYSKINKPFTESSREKIFVVEKGQSASAVARKLETESLIASSFALRVYAFFNNDLKVQAGSFLLDSSMSAKEIFDQLSRGRGLSDEIRVTFLEGGTLDEYAQKLENAGLVSAKDFLAYSNNFPLARDYSFLSDKPKSASLEGYLFPDTYFFAKNSDSRDIAEKFLENFGAKVDSQILSEIAKQGKTVFEIIIMASLVEGEVGRNFKSGTVLDKATQDRLSEERKLVAGVFYNRLQANHALESDATIEYVTKSKRASATLEETKIDHPYNTYRYRGLPPGPINNPSLDSILAAVYPTPTDYFFFLSKPDGEAVFSRTLEEHNENKVRYLK